jgi:hypothetical protein
MEQSQEQLSAFSWDEGAYLSRYTHEAVVLFAMGSAASIVRQLQWWTDLLRSMTPSSSLGALEDS